MKKKYKFLKIFIISFIVAILALYCILYGFLNSIAVRQDEEEIPIPKRRVNVLIPFP